MNAFEEVYKKRYDPELGRYVKKNIYSFEMKEGAKKDSIHKKKDSIQKEKDSREKEKVQKEKDSIQKVQDSIHKRKVQKKKAGDKITQLLEGAKGNEKLPKKFPNLPNLPNSQSSQINERINKLMSRGKLRNKIK